MVKVSITLPNNAQITLESEETEVIHEVVSLVLRDLPRDLMESAPEKNGNGAHGPDTDKSNGVTPISSQMDGEVVVTLTPVTEDPPVAAQEDPPAPSVESPGSPDLKVTEPGPVAASDGPSPTPVGSPAVSAPSVASEIEPPTSAPVLGSSDAIEAERAFVDFCHSVNPLGDMRRVVVVAEGAARHLGLASVDAEELGRLFDLTGWPRAHNFTQTLRNAGRSKFRWLERIPGRSGFYRVTELGRATALGD